MVKVDHFCPLTAFNFSLLRNSALNVLISGHCPISAECILHCYTLSLEQITSLYLVLISLLMILKSEEFIRNLEKIIHKTTGNYSWNSGNHWQNWEKSENKYWHFMEPLGILAKLLFCARCKGEWRYSSKYYWSRPRVGLDTAEQRMILCPWHEQPEFLSCTARSLVTVVIELSWLTARCVHQHKNYLVKGQFLFWWEKVLRIVLKRIRLSSLSGKKELCCDFEGTM